jgi:hypothetical protein
VADPIVAQLEDLAANLPGPDPDVDVAAAAVAEIRAGGRRAARSSRTWPRWLAAAAAVVVVAGASIPAAREAVADLLGIGGVRIRSTGGDGTNVIEPADRADGTHPTPIDLGSAIDLEAAIALAPAPLAAPEGIGAPAAAYAGRPPGAVTLVWAPSSALPEVLDTGVGLLLTTFPGHLEANVIEKRLLQGTNLARTTVGGEPAWWISGAPHAFLYVDEHGNVQEDTARLSANVLLWEQDGATHRVTHRLETSLPLDDARRLAESLQPVVG